MGRILTLMSSVAAAAIAAAPVMAQTAEGGGSAQQALAHQQTPQADPPASSDAVSEVVVTGTSIKGIAPVGSESITLSKQAIERTGAITTEGLLATVPELASFGTRPRTLSGFGAVNTGPDIRGIGQGATLTLVDGHRLAPAGFTSATPDPSGIAPAAIERIEIIPDGASSIYGSDAVAGVVNIILRRNFNGVDASATYGTASGYDEVNANIVAGRTWSTGSVLIGYQYARNSALNGYSRDYNTLNLTSRGGVDGRSIQASPPNINLGGTSYAGPGFAPNTTNYFDGAKDTDIIPREERHSVSATFNQDINALHLFGDAVYSNRSIVIKTPQTGYSVTIDNTNPFFIAPQGTNATSETVDFSGRDIFGRYEYTRENLQNFTVSGGGRYEFGRDWEAQVVSTFGRTRSSILQDENSLDGGRLTAAVAGTTTATALDPFNGRTSPALVSYILDVHNPALSLQKFYDVSAKLDGSIFELPGGDVKFAFGGEFRHETFTGTVSRVRADGSYAGLALGNSGDRDIESGFGEVFIPIVSDRNALPLVKELTLSASGRYDHYEGIGDTTNPRVGLSYTPISGFKLKGTYGTSFRAPTLAETYEPDNRLDVVAGLFLPGFLTPINNTRYNTLIMSGGNASIKPETATTYSIGADYAPPQIPRLKASLTYFHIDYQNVISYPTPGLFTNPALASYYILNPTPAQVQAAAAGEILNGAGAFPFSATQLIVDFRRNNFGSRNIGGLDYSISYNLPTSIGDVTTGLSGTTFLAYDSGIVGAPSVSLLDSGTPSTHLRANLGLRYGPLDATAFVNYVSSYQNTSAAPTQTVGSFTTVDLHLTYDIPTWRRLKPQLVLDIQNLFDKDPPFYQGFNNPGEGILGGFNENLASPLGRFVQFGLRAAF